MVYLLRNGELPGIDLSLDLDKKESFKQAKAAKTKYSIDELCSERAQPLRNFVKSIFALSFKEESNY